jgi:hypothetical protein
MIHPKPDPCDMIIWPDDTWCCRYALAEYSHMSDDYTVLYAGTPEYEDRMMKEFEAEFAAGNILH